MKKHETVLVLGAGASKPYGLPIGAELLTDIIALLHKTHQFHSLLVQGGMASIDIDALREVIQLAQVGTIDEFLGTPGCRDNVVRTNMIKYAIAYGILSKENHEGLYKDWYEKLFRKIFGAGDEFSEDTAIITFNYDRSVEKFLLRTYAARHAVSENDARKDAIWELLPIIHVHGKLASEKDYGDAERFVEASEGIIVNPEGLTSARSGASRPSVTIRRVPGLSDLRRARGYIENAKSIYIFGFGYNERNIEKIGLNNIVTDGDTEIKGTFRGMTPSKQKRIKNTITGIELVDGDINNFLRDEWE